MKALFFKAFRRNPDQVTNGYLSYAGYEASYF